MQDPNRQNDRKPVIPAEFGLFTKHYWPIAKAVVTSPNRFYENMPTGGSLKEPLIFAAVGLSVSSIMSHVIFFQIIQIPMAIVWSFVFAGAFAGASYWLAKSQGGKGSFDATVRVVCYATCVGLVNWIPVLGVVASIGGAVLTGIGISKIHQLPGTKAAVSVIIPGVFVAGAIFLVQLLQLFGRH